VNVPSRPNILLIHADQHRFDCLGAYGNPDVRTPNIDALAAEGVAWTNSFCCFPVCTPSRYSLLTGLYVHQHLGGTNHSTLPSGLPTLPRLLRRAGYDTAAVGKMHFTPTYLDVGFERMRLAEQHGPGRWDDDYHRHLMAVGLADRIDLIDQEAEFRRRAPGAYWDRLGTAVSDVPEEHHSTTWIGDRAVEEIGRWSPDGAHLLMVGFIKPHHPFDPPAPWDRMYDPGALALPAGWTERPLPQDTAFSRGYFRYADMTEASFRRVLAGYYANISHIDQQVGRMIDAVRARGLDARTLVVYTGDHGDYMGCHHLALKGNHMYDPLVKVPLVIRRPGGPAGEVSDALVSNVDVAPTLLAAAGCEAPPEMAGLDLAARREGREVVFAEAGREVMARTRTHKLLLCRDRTQSQLFDLRADPHEMDNLIARPEAARVLADLTDRLTRWSLFEAAAPVHLDERAPRIAADNVPDLDDDHRERMQAYFREKLASAGEDLFAGA